MHDSINSFQIKNPQNACICGFFCLPLQRFNQNINKIMDDYPADNYNS